VGLKRGALSLVSTTEELLGRKSSGSGLEIREYVREDPLRWTRDTPLSANLTLTSPTSGGRSVGIVRSWTQTMEFVCSILFCFVYDIFIQLNNKSDVNSSNGIFRCFIRWEWLSSGVETCTEFSKTRYIIYIVLDVLEYNFCHPVSLSFTNSIQSHRNCITCMDHLYKLFVLLCLTETDMDSSIQPQH
jgi:hypothetical protein